MEIRLNKLLSEAGICSRREADSLIEAKRVTVNGQHPILGRRVTEKDEVLVDGELVRLNWSKLTQENAVSSEPKAKRDEAASSGSRREHYGKYNKYAAARKAANDRDEQKGKPKPDREKAWREATQPKFGKSLSKAAVAQRMAASPKSAALRKTSRNNPANKAKRNGWRGEE